MQSPRLAFGTEAQSRTRRARSTPAHSAVCSCFWSSDRKRRTHLPRVQGEVSLLRPNHHARCSACTSAYERVDTLLCATAVLSGLLLQPVRLNRDPVPPSINNLARSCAAATRTPVDARGLEEPPRSGRDGLAATASPELSLGRFHRYATGTVRFPCWRQPPPGQPA